MAIHRDFHFPNDIMQILAITDIHGQTERFQNILAREPSANLLVIGGDLTNFGRPGDAMDIVDRAREHSQNVVAVAGNCDSKAIDRALSEAGVSVHSEGTVIDDVGVFGVSAMPPWQGTMYEFSENDIDAYLSAGYAMIKEYEQAILVSHTPPRDSGVDVTSSGEAVGSTAVRTHVDRVEPALVLSGHVHEAAGVSEIGPSTIVNCGPAKNGSYATITMDAGDTTVDMKQL